ncbi:MAG TPA: FAD-dependent oxidoreductase [Solirubrobacteraceae bacterium]
MIVGAGIAGASVAHHLAERGWDGVVVVDQGPLWEAGGSTSHAPGLVFQHNASRTMTRLAQWTVALLTELDAFYPVGGIEVATTDERWAELDRRWARARGFGLDARLLSPAEVTELIPLVDPSLILGGLHVADDGIAKGVRAAQALCRDDATTAIGGCEVTGLVVEGGRAVGVETALGTIRAEHVVIATGIWGPRVAALARGLNVPLVPVEHQLAYTAPLPELAGETREVVHPILRHQDHAMYFRQVADGYAIGNYRHEPRLVEPEDIRRDAPEQPAILAFLPEDFATAREEAGRLLPALRDIELTRAFNGLMSFTPDGFPLLGESAAARGLWLAQAIWVTHAGGAGRALAELMTHGDALLDLHECDPQRFDAHGTSRTYWRARGAQGYREVYDVLHPRQQSEQVRGLRTTPFYERQADLGAHFFESAGWERPQWYEANGALLTGDEVMPHDDWAARYWSPIIQAEHRACRERAGLFDLTPFTKVEVAGAGALRFLQHLAANDVDKRVGAIVYTAMLSPRGGIMCDLTITRLGAERFWVVTGGAVGRHDIAWMRRHLPDDGSVVLTDLTSALCCIGVWGPLARELVGARTEDDLSNDALPYMRAATLHIGPVPCRALRLSYVGELGWEIYAPTEFGRGLWDTLWEAGRELGAAACGGGAYDSLRLEKGYRLWGQDIDEEHDPYEAGLGWAVRLTKEADFIGREAAAASAERGVERRLCCLVTDDPAVMLVGKEPLLDDGRPVGYVTSAGYGATMGESILYAYLPGELAEPGTALSVHSAGTEHAVTVVSEPRFDPEMARLKDAAAAGAPAAR